MSAGGDGYNFKRLKAEILERSKSTNWEIAKQEWALVGIDEADDPQTCLCGHHPIMEICALYNRLTRTHAEVGNICVKRFLGIRSDQIFAGIKRVRKDGDKSLNAECIEFFYERKVISTWEYDFLGNTFRKRVLSDAQLRTRQAINAKVLRAIAQRGFQGFGLNRPPVSR